ncbi:MAG: hypothetical protein F6J96_12965 [Symploca sp. SIO1C2]|nr:hypothetical protein [Symploca sp. SIO1C2]
MTNFHESLKKQGRRQRAEGRRKEGFACFFHPLRSRHVRGTLRSCTKSKIDLGR